MFDNKIEMYAIMLYDLDMTLKRSTLLVNRKHVTKYIYMYIMS